MTKEKEQSSWEEEDLESEVIPDHEVEEAFAHSHRNIRITKAVDGRVVISASTPKKDF